VFSWLNPLTGYGYQFWSGIGSGSPILAGVLLHFRRHNCHVRGCPFVIFRAHPDDPEHLICRRHHRRT
jgi:hypothetical protein